MHILCTMIQIEAHQVEEGELREQITVAKHVLF